LRPNDEIDRFSQFGDTGGTNHAAARVDTEWMR
jgi:hypothetical protein